MCAFFLYISIATVIISACDKTERKEMTERLIRDLEQVSIEWLTRVLTARGALTKGVVSGFEVDGGAGNWSSNARLKLRYSEDAEGEKPEKLFLKMVSRIAVENSSAADLPSSSGCK